MTDRLFNFAAATLSLTAACGFGSLAVDYSKPTQPVVEVAVPALVIEPSVVDLGQARQNQTLTGSYSVVWMQF